jgi:hypothetical protein
MPRRHVAGLGLALRGLRRWLLGSGYAPHEVTDDRTYQERVGEGVAGQVVQEVEVVARYHVRGDRDLAGDSSAPGFVRVVVKLTDHAPLKPALAGNGGSRLITAMRSQCA